MTAPFQQKAWVSGWFVVAVNVVINACPIMVQRYNRVRLLRLVSAELRQSWGFQPAASRSEILSPKCNVPMDRGGCS